MTKELWEILVPVSYKGKELSVEFHQVWDAKVKAITGGLTIMKPTKKGYWKEHEEKMIPVRIAATREQMDEIGQMTKHYYSQESVMVYRISNEVIFYE